MMDTFADKLQPNQERLGLKSMHHFGLCTSPGPDPSIGNLRIVPASQQGCGGKTSQDTGGRVPVISPMGLRYAVGGTAQWGAHFSSATIGMCALTA